MTRESLYEALVEGTPLAFLAVRSDGVVVFASQAIRTVLGREPAEAVGTNVIDWLHPDDVERALVQLATSAAAGITRGITRFNVAHSDGTWVPVEAWASSISEGEEPLVAICARDGRAQVFLEEVTAMLLHGAPRSEALVPVLNTIGWQAAGSKVAIEWVDSSGCHQVNSGDMADALGGAPVGLVEPNDDPWSRARNAFETVQGTASDLDLQLQSEAAAAEVTQYWIEPVRWSEQHLPATVTVWTADGYTPEIHSYGMGVAKNLVELILRWTEQVQELDLAARFDPLTGLHNRRSLFAALAQGTGGGAVLYCDLDEFKPVNDTLGHAAGDELLRLVAKRLQATVRDRDMVARIGGDEFVVLSEGATPEEARHIADRIRASLQEPFSLGHTLVTVGISVGVGYSATALTTEVLDAADRELSSTKASRPR